MNNEYPQNLFSQLEGVMPVSRREDIENLKELFGDEYMDFNLVFASSCGRPIEGQVINRVSHIS